MKSDLKKFSFDFSFDEELSAEDLIAQHEDEKKKIFEDAYAQGLVEGKKLGDQEAKSSIEANQFALLQRMSTQLCSFLAEMDSKREQNAELSFELVKKIAEKMFMNVTLDDKLNIAKKALSHALPLVVEEEKIEFFVQDNMVDFLKHKIDSSLEFQEIKSRLIVLPLPSGSDLLSKIRWKKGEIEVNPSEFWKKLEPIFDQFQTQTQDVGAI